MRSRYAIVFSIEVLNSYFGHGKWKEITFTPLPETKRLLSEQAYQVRQIGNQLLVITKVDENNKPLKLPELFAKFSFRVQPESPNYINFTNLALPPAGMKCFAFHNLHNNSAAGVNYISAGIEEYQNTVTYMPGDFAKGADGKIYEAIKTNPGSQLPDDTLAASKNFWALQGDVQFVSGSDTVVKESGKSFDLEFSGQLYNFKTAVKNTMHTVNVYAFNFITRKYDKQVFHDIVTFDTLHDIVQVDLRTLVSGRYKISVNNDIRFVYLNTSPDADGIPMFLEIFHLPKTDPQSFLKPDDTLKHIKYTVRFASRRVYWRYKTRTNTIDKIDDSSGEYTFAADGLRLFISEKPIPLSDMPRKTLTANTGTLIITSPLPNPRADRLLDKRNEIFTTESFINF